MKAKRAGKRGLTARKLAQVRSATVYGKTDEETAIIYGVTPRCVRRAVDWMKSLAGVYTKQDLIVWMAAHHLLWCSEETKKDYLKKEDWRDAA